MIVFVSGSTRTMQGFGAHPNLGVFFNPKSSNYRRQLLPVGMPWAADNAAYKGFDLAAFERMLDTLYQRRLPGCRFVACPDVVGDAPATLRLFASWRPMLVRYGWPLAFVAQDGLRAKQAPWGLFDTLFIGGSTRWKLGSEAYTLCAYAQALGKNVHIGRVNSAERAAEFTGVANSIDGTATSMFGDVYVPKMITAAQRRYDGPKAIQRELAI